MRKSKIIIEPATREHVKEFYGDKYTKSFKGHVALLDGKIVGIAGLGFEKDQMLLFSEITEEMRPFKKDIVKAVYMLDRMVKEAKYPIVAIANKKEAMSEKLLVKLGFISTGCLASDGSKIFRRVP